MQLSIITINLNNNYGLKKTIDSVLSQTFNNFEFIVIDGGSLDGSVEVLKEYLSGMVNWISETDAGIYNAMNKGIAKADGEYILFLNSGDFLVNNDVLKSVFSNSELVDIMSGDTLLINKAGKKKIIPAPEEFNLQNALMFGLAHASTFIRTSLFDRFGNYNEERKIISDWEFFVKAIVINKVSYKRIPITISYFDSNGISNKCQQLLEKEKFDVLSEIYPSEILGIIKEYISLKTRENKIKNNGLIQAGIYLSKYRNIRRFFNKFYFYFKKLRGH
jgi:glycosyltransferase involved in cell wall biosynthesis